MKRIIQMLCLSFLCLAAVSCSGDKPAAEKKSAATPQVKTTAAPPSYSPAQPIRKADIIRTITPDEAKSIIAEKKNLLLVDIRSPQELREGYIANSTLVPLWEIAKGQINLPTNRPLLLICAVGGRSFAVGQFLNQKGYPEIYNLKGGISAWKAAGLPLQYK